MQILGAEVHNFKKIPHDFADSEVWCYFGVDKTISQLIVRGFPAYWLDKLAWGDEFLVPCRRIARDYRRWSLPVLAEQHFPGIEPFLQWGKYLSVQQYTMLDPTLKDRLRSDPLKFHLTDNPFRILHLISKIANPTIDPLSWSCWTEAAQMLLSEFFEILNTSPFLRDEFSERTVKERHCLLDGAIFVRGQRMLDQASLSYAFRYSQQTPIRWGPLCYSAKTVAESHFCAVGLARTGKTSLLRLLFQSLHEHKSEPARFVLYDAKPDLLPYIFPPGHFNTPPSDADIRAHIYLLNPFDRRTTAWDIATDASDTAKAREVANILFPVDDPKHPHFTESIRDLAVSAMGALREKAGGNHWTFYQLLAALQPANIEAVLSTTAHGKEQLDTYLSGAYAAPADTRRTLRAMSALCMPAAYAWHFAEHRLSLRDWVRQDSKSIVLANDNDHPDAIKEVNRILLNLLCSQLLAVKSKPARTYLYLDEFERLGRIENLPQLTQQGADRGVNLAFCLHDLQLLKEVYHASTEGILSLCSFYCFLKLQAPETLRWASSLLGSQEVKVFQTTEQSYDHGSDKQQHASESTTAHQLVRQLVLPDEISALRFPESAKEIEGYFIAPRHARYKGGLSLESLYASEQSSSEPTLWPPSPYIEEFAEPPFDISPPDDTFETLHDLGFSKDGYSPPRQAGIATQPEDAQAEPETDSANLPQTEPAEDVPTPHEDRTSRSPSLSDYDFQWDFGDE